MIGGATGNVYEDSSLECFSVSNPRFIGFIDLLVGGAHEGTKCYAITSEDLASPETVVLAESAGGEITFASDGQPGEPHPVMQNPPLAEDGFAFGETTEFEGPGRSIWRIKIDAPLDVTDVANQQYVGTGSATGEPLAVIAFEVEAELVSASTEPLSLMGSAFELFGRDSGVVFTELSTPDLYRYACPNELSDFDERRPVNVGEVTTGTVCLGAPAADIAHPGLQIRLWTPGPQRPIFRADGRAGSALAIGERDTSDTSDTSSTGADSTSAEAEEIFATADDLDDS